MVRKLKFRSRVCQKEQLQRTLTFPAFSLLPLGAAIWKQIDVSFILLGRASWTKHIRKGKELPDIARDDNYNFNFQVECKPL